MLLVHVSIMLGILFGMEHLCASALPIEQFHWSGISFLPDLMVPDSTSYATLHLTHCILYLNVKYTWYRVTNMEACDMRQASVKARGKPACKAAWGLKYWNVEVLQSGWFTMCWLTSHDWVETQGRTCQLEVKCSLVKMGWVQIAAHWLRDMTSAAVSR